MQYLTFSIFIFCLIAFFDVFFTIKKPLIFRYNLLLLILGIFITNYISYNNIKEGYLFSFFPIINMLIGSNLIIFINYITANKIDKWVVYNLISAFILATVFSFYLLFNPSIFSFYNDQYNSFYILPQFWYLNIIRILFKFIILFSLVRLLYIFFNKTKANNIYIEILRNWMFKFILLSFTVSINCLILLFLNNNVNSGKLLSYTLLFMSYMVLLSIIYKPKFLGFHNFSMNKISNFNKSLSLVLSDQNFILPFFQNQYFLKKDANLEKFCNENNINDKEEFNDVIVSSYKMSFNNLINKYRVQYFLEIVIASKYENYSIDALAQEAGFSSRHHLYKPFKKFHGGTPSDYLYFANN